jgi:hypothetical protein
MILRLRTLFQRDRIERELEDEFQFDIREPHRDRNGARALARRSSLRSALRDGWNGATQVRVPGHAPRELYR